MTKLNNTTKRAVQMLRSYEYYLSRNNGNSLYEIYSNFSENKYCALEYCKALMAKKQGWNPCFCGHNSMTFTYAFLFIENDKLYLAYITKDNDYMIEYKDV